VNGWLSEGLHKLLYLTLYGEHTPLVNPECHLSGLRDLYEQAMILFHKLPRLPVLNTHYNPSQEFFEARFLDEFRETLLDLLQRNWEEIWNLFERVLTPELRSWWFEQMAPHMPPLRVGGKSFYSVKRKLGVVTTLFPRKYMTQPFYDRLLTAPVDLPEDLVRVEPTVKKRKSKSSSLTDGTKKKKDTCSTLTSTQRHYKSLCVNVLNRLLKDHGAHLTLVEIDLVSCHARVLSYLYPLQTPELRRIFRENASLWEFKMIF